MRSALFGPGSASAEWTAAAAQSNRLAALLTAEEPEALALTVQAASGRRACFLHTRVVCRLGEEEKDGGGAPRAVTPSRADGGTVVEHAHEVQVCLPLPPRWPPPCAPLPLSNSPPQWLGGWQSVALAPGSTSRAALAASIDASGRTHLSPLELSQPGSEAPPEKRARLDGSLWLEPDVDPLGHGRDRTLLFSAP